NRSNSPVGNTNAAAPSILQILGHILNSAFVDTLENDLEFLRDMNDVLDQLPQGVINSPKISSQKIELLEISPSKEINILAKQFYDELPKQMAKHIKPDSSSTLLSLILFEKGFCSALWKMGYEDALSKESKIRHFFRK
ncbi:MAG: NTE family protein, partial [Pseudohongiellaceae bacterium]